MGRIVWFGLLGLGAPAEGVLIAAAAVLGGVAYCAYKAGKSGDKKTP